MDDVSNLGVVDGIWYVDNTKYPGPQKQRNFVVYPASQQETLNEALRDNARALKLEDPRSYSEASVNLETMEHLCSGAVRVMKLTDRSGRLLYFWESLNEDKIQDESVRTHLGNLACYLYWKQSSSQLNYEFTDPAALQNGDTWEDALLRGIGAGVTIPECNISDTLDSKNILT